MTYENEGRRKVRSYSIKGKSFPFPLLDAIQIPLLSDYAHEALSFASKETETDFGRNLAYLLGLASYHDFLEPDGDSPLWRIRFHFVAKHKEDLGKSHEVFDEPLLSFREVRDPNTAYGKVVEFFHKHESFNVVSDIEHIVKRDGRFFRNLTVEHTSEFELADH